MVFIIKLNKDFNFLNKNDLNINFVKQIENKKPQINLGFTKLIWETKNKYENPKILNKINKTNKHVVNEYEHIIHGHKDINSFAEKFSNNKIISRAFYKCWEMLFYFPTLIDLDNKNFKCLCMAEAPGGFVQSIISYRQKYSNQTKNDIYNAISLKDGIKMNTDVLHKYKGYSVLGKNRENDLTKLDTFNYLNENKEQYDLITGDGGFQMKFENEQEQEMYFLLYGQIINAINLQKKGGSFILKIYEMYTDITINIIYLIKMFYEDVYIVKPNMSRITNSEKYVVCLNFKYGSEDILFKYKKILMQVFKNLIIKNEQKYKLSTLFKHDDPNDIITLFNVICSNKQIEKMEEFYNLLLNNNNITEHVNKQIHVRDLFIKSFFPKDRQSLVKIQKSLQDDLKLIINTMIEKK